jgi:preprotein translocase subunit SecG
VFCNTSFYPKPSIIHPPYGVMAEWLGGGLQNRSPRFNSGSRLHEAVHLYFNPNFIYLYSMTPLTLLEVIISILMATVILVQQQGSGLGGAFGGDGNVYRSKRGVEKWLYYATIILAIAFFAVAIIAMLTQ